MGATQGPPRTLSRLERGSVPLKHRGAFWLETMRGWGGSLSLSFWWVELPSPRTYAVSNMFLRGLLLYTVMSVNFCIRHFDKKLSM